MWTTTHRNRLPYLLLALILAWTVSEPCRSVSAAVTEPILLHDAPEPQTDTAPINPTMVLRQRHVTWDPQLFDAAPLEHLVLDLFEDCRYTATLLMSEAGPAGDLVWVGHIDGQPNSRMTLVVHGLSASALIQIGNRRFDLRPVSPPLHVIQEINAVEPTAFQPDDTETPQYSGHALLASDRAAATRANMTNEEFTVFTLVNKERRKHGQFPLNADHRLTAAARAHSRDMSDNDYFSHTSPDGLTGGDRITAAGYTWSRWAENIAHGYTSPEAVMLGWMNSEGHRKNILSPDLCDLGVGYVSAGRYWTQNFGRLRGVTTCAPQDREPYTPPEGSNGGSDNESDGGSSRGSSDESDGGCFVGALARHSGARIPGAPYTLYCFRRAFLTASQRVLNYPKIRFGQELKIIKLMAFPSRFTARKKHLQTALNFGTKLEWMSCLRL